MSFNELIFDSSETIIRTLTIGIMAYFAIVIIIRISGKRSLTQLNAFDLVVTVALGSILSSIIINKDVTITQGIAAFLVLITLQYIITKIAVNTNLINKFIKSTPVMLFYNGEFYHENMKSERVVETEIKQAIRSNGNGGLSDVLAVILETDGSLSVINKQSGDDTIDKNSPLFSEVKR